MSTAQWTEAAVKAIDRAFHEVVECEPWQFGIDPDDEDGAIAGLVAIRDHEVPAHNRMDLLIAQHATRIDDKVLRAIARLFASSRHPDRIQAPNGEQFWGRDEDADEGPSSILQHLEEQAPAGTLFLSYFAPNEPLESKPRVEPVEPPARPHVPPAHHLNVHTLSSMHVRTIRAYAEKLQEHEVVRACDGALGPPIDPLAWALELRRQLAGIYNSWFLDGMTPLGRWGAHAFRQIGIASWRCFADPDDGSGEAARADLLATAQAALRDLRPDDVPWDDRADLHHVQTARSLDVASLRAMARLWTAALACRVRAAEQELGRSALDRS